VTGRPSGPHLFGRILADVPEKFRSCFIHQNDRSRRHGGCAQLRHLRMQCASAKPAAVASGAAAASTAGGLGPAQRRTREGYHRFILRARTSGARHQQRRGLRSTCDDGGVAHAADRLACESDQSQDRQIGGCEDQRSRSVREGPRDRPVKGRGKAHRDRSSRCGKGQGDPPRGSSIRERGCGGERREDRGCLAREGAGCRQVRKSSGDRCGRDSQFARISRRRNAGNCFALGAKKENGDRFNRSPPQ